MIKPAAFILSVLLFLFASCNSSIKPGELYGKWKYIKIQHPNADPTDSVRSADVQRQSPSIEFTKDNNYAINFSGKVLSHGTFTVKDRNILIKEILPDGTTREFPFYVSELTDKEIVFDTKGEDGTIVTAVRE